MGWEGALNAWRNTSTLRATVPAASTVVMPLLSPKSHRQSLGQGACRGGVETQCST